jgi:hypothetical protein
MNKYEALIEHIINDDEDKARALFHEIVVEKSREIYESLMDEEYTEEDVGGDQVQGLVDEITVDETDGIGEGDDQEDGELDMDDMGDESPMGNMDDMDDMDGEQDLEQKVMDLESELEALKAEFEQLMGNEEGEEDEMDMDMDMDKNMAEAQHDDEDEMTESKHDDEDEMTESKHDDEEEDDDNKKMEESRQYKALPKTAVDLMREYVEKISAPGNTEFAPVGTGTGGDKAAGNTKTPVAGKNDMGGSTANIAKGGSEQAPDGNSPNGKAGGFLKNPQEIDVAKRNVNVPGGNKGAQNWYNTKTSAKKGEGQTTDGSVPVQKKSIEPGGN